MEPIDLRKFIWMRDEQIYIILAITHLREYNVVIYRESTNSKGGKIDVDTLDDFLAKFTATYQVRQ